MTRLTLHLLGYPHITLDGKNITGALLPYQKAFALLVYLAVTGRSHSRLHLAELLWPGLEEKVALTYLRGRAGLAKLRPLLRDFLHIEPHALAFKHNADTALDIRRYQDLQRTHPTVESLSRAAALYHADFCAGFLPKDVSPEFEMWLVSRREQFREQQMQILDHLVERYARWQEFTPALQHARQLLALDPWREETHRELMRLYARQGQRERALDQYAQCRRLLEQELGVAPHEETEKLHRDIQHNTLAPLPPVPFLAPDPPPILSAAGRIWNAS